jgi:DNA-binding response OmpR family regulator
MHRILIVEDEDAIRLGLVDLLEMPKVSGYDVCRFIRKTFPQIFILMLTAKTEEINKIQGLEMGADDYVTKPFSVFELMARIKSMLRRVEHDKALGSEPHEVLEFDDIRIDFKRYEAFKSKMPMELSAKEFQILKYFSTRKGEVVTREDLLQAIWGYSLENMPTTRTVDNQIVKLRQKIETDTENPTVIKSVRGVGYKFDPPEAKPE